MIPQTVPAPRGSHGVALVPGIFPSLWSRSAAELPPRIHPPPWSPSLASGLAWAPGWPWPRWITLKWAKDQFGSKNDEKIQVLRMEFSIVEHLSGPPESSFSLFRSNQFNSHEKDQVLKFINLPHSPYFPTLSLFSWKLPIQFGELVLRLASVHEQACCLVSRCSQTWFHLTLRNLHDPGS